ncbi:MAG TPA: fumarylacetoacetate hydrolase family protein [Vicinamibacterales bacterium]|nr:fumarylacetoacetate hydrolase family protein [Vicinamibacterales bacterium]
MHIVSFVPKAATGAPPRVGALLADRVHILDFAVAVDLGDTQPPPMAWYDLDGEWLPQAMKIVNDAGGSIPESWWRRPGALLALEDVRLLAPVPRPGKVICIGLNYRDHAAESGLPVPESPITFSKYVTSVTHPSFPVYLPPSSEKVDYEAELAFVIGRRAKHVPASQAFEYVLGYTNFNDVSARDFQFADGQWQRGKSCDTFAPMGPAIVTRDEIPDPHRLRIQLRLNGVTMQDSSTNQLIFGVDRLIEFISATVTLEPGDVIATGTPPGVGFARKPPVFLKPGDLMEVEIEGLGILSNPVLREHE